MNQHLLLVRRCALALAITSLTACGGGDLDEWIDDVVKGVYLDQYEDSCDGATWKTVTRVPGNQSILMSVRVKTTGDVEPLNAVWNTTTGHSMGSGVISSTASVDGTGRKFTLTVVVNSSGDLAYEIRVRDKNNTERYITTCKVHVS